MSAAENLESRLKALQCHFTWDLEPSRSKLFHLMDKLEDIGTEEGNIWLGHIYNLQGFIQNHLGSVEEAQRFFSKATEAFQQVKTTDDGPWLEVNYGNLAWQHHQLGEDEKSQVYLSKVDALMKKYPSPVQGEPHPEVYAEKAWTLMKFDKEKKLQAADFFQKAFRMQPEMVQWQTSRLLALMSAYKHDPDLVVDILEDLRVAIQEDPENLYLAAVELKPLLRAFRQMGAFAEGVAVAERALNQNPESRYLKRCAGLSYKWKVLQYRDKRPNQRLINQAISLYREVVALYPQTSLVKQLDLANILAKSDHGQMEAEQMYQDLLTQVQDPADKPLLFNNYAKYLRFIQNDWNESVRYHMKAAAINHPSFYRNNSIKVLEKIGGRGRSRMSREVQEFLEKLNQKPV